MFYMWEKKVAAECFNKNSILQQDSEKSSHVSLPCILAAGYTFSDVLVWMVIVAETVALMFQSAAI